MHRCTDPFQSPQLGSSDSTRFALPGFTPPLTSLLIMYQTHRSEGARSSAQNELDTEDIPRVSTCRPPSVFSRGPASVLSVLFQLSLSRRHSPLQYLPPPHPVSPPALDPSSAPASSPSSSPPHRLPHLPNLPLLPRPSMSSYSPASFLLAENHSHPHEQPKHDESTPSSRPDSCQDGNRDGDRPTDHSRSIDIRDHAP
jgi:hypothetical protein